ncbi:MAG: ABC transporter substrate-binding protein [Pseudomonadota bacterium]
MMKKVEKTAWCTVLMAIVCMSFLPATCLSAPKRGGTVIISSGFGVPPHCNPAIASGSAIAMVGAQVFASPLRYDDKWNPQPYLAQSWEFSKDGLSLTLKLVQDATFHDGHPITSEDVAFSLLSVQKYHPFKSMFAPVARVDTPDPATVVIRLTQPNPAILLAMSPALLPILPKHIYGDGQDLRTHTANLQPIGSGPFTFLKNIPGKYLVLKRNDTFFIKDRPYLNEIVIRFDNDPSAQLVFLEHLDAHLLPLFIDPESIDKLENDKRFVIEPRGHEGIGAINWLAFNLLHKPLDDKWVRQAIAYSIDPEFINNYMNRGRSLRATGPLSPFSPFYEPDVHKYKLDLAKAGELLDKAGLPITSSGTRFAITLDYIPIIPSQQHDIAFYIKRQLLKIGIDAHVRSSKNIKEWSERIGNWDFDMTMDAVYNWGDPIIGVHRTYLSQNIREGVIWSNTQNYRNYQVDSILDLAARETDKDKRKILYSKFQKILTDDLPILWLNVMPYQTVFNKNLWNPPISIWGVHSPLDELYWETVPQKTYTATPPLEDKDSTLKRTGIRTITLLKEKELFEAVDILENEELGYSDLLHSGLHVIGFTTKGIVFLDNSGQMKSGMDINGLLDNNGQSIVEQLIEAGGRPGGGTVDINGLWPHPETNQVSPITAWCGELTHDDRICALTWQ